MSEAKIDLNTFVTIVTHIEEQLERDDKLTDLLVCKDSTGWVAAAPDLVSDTVALLSIMLEDEDEWIEWWLWELADDKSNANVYCDDENGNYCKYTIKDLEDLYYLILDEMDKIKTKEPSERPEEGVDDIIRDTVDNVSLYEMFMSQATGYTETQN